MEAKRCPRGRISWPWVGEKPYHTMCLNGCRNSVRIKTFPDVKTVKERVVEVRKIGKEKPSWHIVGIRREPAVSWSQQDLAHECQILPHLVFGTILKSLLQRELRVIYLISVTCSEVSSICFQSTHQHCTWRGLIPALQWSGSERVVLLRVLFCTLQTRALSLTCVGAWERGQTEPEPE